ncbi:MAG: hypothetical protein LBU89_08730 [Fibromonadaceae bacterium]|jgi:hypothetical protein|nr:hypothetical protein [Fibromonadaceae bacterium]
MKCKFLILLYAIALCSCFSSNNNYLRRGCFGESLEKLHEYENCKLGNLNVTYPCPMDTSLAHELVDLFSSDYEIVERIGGGGICDSHSTSRQSFCNSSNPQNGCDTLKVGTLYIRSDLTINVMAYTYLVTRVEGKWDVLGPEIKSH